MSCDICGRANCAPMYHSIEKQIEVAMEMAERNGFMLKDHHHVPDKLALLAAKSPYANGVVIREFERWEDVITYLIGYEQRIIETQLEELEK